MSRRQQKRIAFHKCQYCQSPVSSVNVCFCTTPNPGLCCSPVFVSPDRRPLSVTLRQHWMQLASPPPSPAPGKKPTWPGIIMSLPHCFALRFHFPHRPQWLLHYLHTPPSSSFFPQTRGQRPINRSWSHDPSRLYPGAETKISCAS